MLQRQTKLKNITMGASCILLAALVIVIAYSPPPIQILVHVVLQVRVALARALAAISPSKAPSFGRLVNVLSKVATLASLVLRCFCRPATMSATVRCQAAISSRTATAVATRCPRKLVACRAATHNITFRAPTGEETRFQCQADKNLLEGALAAGVELPHLCRTGTCGVCAARVLEGNVERADFMLDDLQQEHGFALLCTTYPKSDLTIATQQEKELHTVPYGL